MLPLEKRGLALCVECRHPLVFRNDRKRLAERGTRQRAVFALNTARWTRPSAPDAAQGTRNEEPGHYVRFVTTRSGLDEFLCINCGHPFCFASGLAEWAPTPAATPEHPLAVAAIGTTFTIDREKMGVK